jgi:CRISPR system Cascade subunit CasA
MTEAKFNLIDEPWIVVINLQGKEEVLSLKEVLLRSHEMKSFSGEMLAQDISILRLLLGILYAIYTRKEEYQRAKGKDCLAIWKSVWDDGCFDKESIVNYFEIWRNRFDLLDSERPFYQVSGLVDGTSADITRMVGDVDRYFKSRNIGSNATLSFAEAARWLLYLNDYDTITMAPNRRKNLNVGLLGQMNIVYAEGKNLFKTIMLNFRLYSHNRKPWESGQATWERDTPRTGDRTEIAFPESGEELFTLQSRRVRLKHQDGRVFGIVIHGGDYFDSTNAFSEPMTTWKFDKKTGVYNFGMPYDDAASKQIWRDFSSLFVQSDDKKLPGIIEWVSDIQSADMISKSDAVFSNLIMRYRNRSLVTDIWSDSLSVNASLLSELEKDEKGWVKRITDLVKMTESMVDALGKLSLDLSFATGMDPSPPKSPKQYEHRRKIIAPPKELAYSILDMPFRKWLVSIDTKESSMDEKCDEWEDIAKDIVLKQGENLVAQSGAQALVGRYINGEYYSASIVYSWFKSNITKKI